MLGQESSEHATMVEAFGKRLRQLYPEPPTVYSEGKKLLSPPLKPDVYIRHPDGRQWVFEMVYGNQQASLLAEHHQAYARENIQDVWILWETLEPKKRRKRKKTSLKQGIMPSLIQERAIYRLNAPQRAILEMQTGNVRYLYAFTINAVGPGQELVTEPTVQTMMVGICAYEFEEWSGQDRYPAEDYYIPVPQLEFHKDGSLVVPKVPENLQKMASVLGFGADSPVIIPAQLIDQLNRLPALAEEKAEPLLALFLTPFFSNLTKETLQELTDFFQSGRAAQIQQELKSSEPVDVFQAVQSPEETRKLLEEIEQKRELLANADIPEPLKSFFLSMLNTRMIEHMAEWNRWQQESQRLRQARENAKRGQADEK